MQDNPGRSPPNRAGHKKNASPSSPSSAARWWGSPSSSPRRNPRPQNLRKGRYPWTRGPAAPGAFRGKTVAVFGRLGKPMEELARVLLQDGDRTDHVRSRSPARRKYLWYCLRRGYVALQGVFRRRGEARLLFQGGGPRILRLWRLSPHPAVMFSSSEELSNSMSKHNTNVDSDGAHLGAAGVMAPTGYSPVGAIHVYLCQLRRSGFHGM